MMTKILAIDDDREILNLVKRALEREGYEVTTAERPAEVRPESLNRYQLILLDVMMPGMDGFSFCEKIRELVDCPILFLSAKTAEADLMKGLGIGGDDYITKPFGIGELRARVAAHLRRENREKKHALALGEVEIFLDAKKLFGNGVEIPLTRGEYEICAYLALNRGQVFSKERIYEHVFGYDAAGDSSCIAEHIKNIRMKLQKQGVSPIETVWGIGYRWK